MQSIPSTRTPLRVLLADDDPMSLVVTSRLIEQQGDRVVQVSGGKQALQRASLEGFDVILLDIHMPDVGGLSAARNLRETGVTAPIVGLTGNTEIATGNDWREAGMDHCLLKPVQINSYRDLTQPLRFAPL